MTPGGRVGVGLLELTSGYEAQIAVQQARRDSRTSSKPPSSDPPKTRQQRRAGPGRRPRSCCAGSHRKAGAARIPGSGRELEPEDQVDEIVHHYPDVCRG